jgi:hypothetical protein
MVVSLALVATIHLVAQDNKKLDKQEMAKEKREKLLDEEYLKDVVPFKVELYTRRGPPGRVVLVELLTRLDCRPCVAADVAFDAALKAYQPRDVILLQYIAPLGNADAAQRANSQNNAPSGGTPCTRVSGGANLALAGNKAAGQDRYAKLAKAIDEKLAGDAAAKIGLSVKQTGDDLAIAVAVSDLASPGADTKLRLALIEKAVRYPAPNGVRIHHHVVRAMPGGADGFTLKEPAAKQEVTIDLAALRKSLGDALLPLTDLAVVAFIQNDKTGEVLQATQADVHIEK